MGVTVSTTNAPSQNSPVSKKPKPITVRVNAKITASRIKSMRLVLKSEPFVYAFRRFVDRRGKIKLLIYFDELEKLKKDLVCSRDQYISNTRELIKSSGALGLLFYSSDTKYTNNSEMEADNLAVECLQPLLLKEPHEQVPVRHFYRTLRMCENNLLEQLLPAYKDYINSRDFQQYKNTEMAAFKNVYQQVMISETIGEVSHSVTAHVDVSDRNRILPVSQDDESSSDSDDF
jgi:hypothetical protein